PQQILVVLSGEPRHAFGSVALSRRAVTRLAEAEVHAGAVPHLHPVTHGSRTPPLQTAQVTCDVRNVLCRLQAVSVGIGCHADVRPLAVAIVDELPREDGEVLTGKRRHEAILISTPLRTVAAGAGRIELLSAYDIRG